LAERDLDGLREVADLARGLERSASGRRQWDLRRLVYSAERNAEYVAARTEIPAAAPTTRNGLEMRLSTAERQLSALQNELADIRRLATAAAPLAQPVPEERPAPEAPTAPVEVRHAPPTRDDFGWDELEVAEPEPSPPQEVQWEPSITDRAATYLREKSAAWILAWAGGLVTALGVVLLFALAVNRGWIGPGARVATGGLVSALVFGTGLWARRRFGTTYSALAAVGAGIAGAYATLFAATALYDLVPPPAALVCAAAVAAVSLVVSLSFRSELVAGLGLIGAMVAPVGVYDGDVTVLGTAFAVLMLAASGIVSVRLKWGRLAFVATVASLPQFVVLAVDDVHPDLLPLGAALAVVYLAMAVGHQQVSGADGLQRLPTWLVLVSAFVGAAGITSLYDDPVAEGRGLLIVAVLYGVVAAGLMRLPRQRELGVLAAVVALTIGAGAMADLFGDRTLAVVWALEAGLLAWLARRVRDPRFQLTALAYFGLALGHSLTVEEWQRALFFVSPHPAHAWPTLVALMVGAAAIGWFCPAFGRQDVPRGGVFGALAPVFDELERFQPTLRLLALVSAAVLSLGTLSLATLAAAVRLAPTMELGFERGQVAVDVLWAVTGLVAVWVGPGRRWSRVAAFGWVWLAVTLGKLVAYDVDHLVRPERSVALMVVGAALLLAAYAVRRLEPTAVVAALVSIPLLTGGAVELARGDLFGVDADGIALFLLAAAYGALSAACFRERRDFSTLLWVTSLALVAAAWPIVLSGGWLVLAWSATVVAAAVLAEALREKRFLPAAYGFLLLAVGHALSFETPPDLLFRAEAHPAKGVGWLAMVIVATAVVALVCRRTRPAEPSPARTWYQRITADLEDDQGWLAALTALAGAVLAVLAGSLLILEIAQALSAGTVDTDFQRGHVAVSAFYGVLGLVLLYLGLVRRIRWLRYAGFVAFGVTVGKIFLYDLSNLSAVARALSFLGVGAVLLLGGFFYQRLSAELEDRRRPPVNAGGSA
jgi:hypothetical protein